MAEDEPTKDWKHPDARMPTDQERRELCKMLSFTLMEIRLLGWEGKAEQAADLADAFHYLPGKLWSDEFSFGFFRKFLEDYQQQYVGRTRFDYVKWLDRIITPES
jgi:hypothetical protein